MSDEHYRRGDPETGCGLMVVVVLAIAVVFWVALILAILDLAMFA